MGNRIARHKQADIAPCEGDGRQRRIAKKTTARKANMQQQKHACGLGLKDIANKGILLAAARTTFSEYTLTFSLAWKVLLAPAWGAKSLFSCKMMKRSTLKTTWKIAISLERCCEN